MAKILSNLRVGVRVFLDESAQADFLDSEVDRSINYNYQDVAAEVMEIYEEYYFTTTPISINTIANQQEYPLDSSLIKTERVEINYDPTNPNSLATRARAIRLDELPRDIGNQNAAGSALYGAGYYIIGSQSAQKIGFVPIPTKDGTAAVSVWGIQAPSDMVEATDPVIIPFPDRFARIIELGAARDLLRKGQQAEDAASNYDKLYLMELSRMKTFLKERQADGPAMIIDSAMEDVSLDYSL